MAFMEESFPQRCMSTRDTVANPTGIFLNMNGIGDGIMRKNKINASLTETEIQRNKGISKIRYKIEQYFRITHKCHGAGKARFTTIVKKNWDHLCGVMTFNIKRVAIRMKKQEMIAAT